MFSLKKTLVLFTVSAVLLASCTNVGVFEKNVAIPGHAWSSSFKPSVSFTISDTTALYKTYIVIRHTDAYHYKNLWVNLYTAIPGDTVQRKQRYELTLATDDKGWLGSGMDDIYEQRLPVPIANQIPAIRAGQYTFTLENIMREDPLQGVMNVGIRIEKER